MCLNLECTGIVDADGTTKPSSLFEAQALHSHYSVVSWQPVFLPRCATDVDKLRSMYERPTQIFTLYQIPSLLDYLFMFQIVDNKVKPVLERHPSKH